MKAKYIIGVILYAMIPVLAVLYLRSVSQEDKFIGQQARISTDAARSNYQDVLQTNNGLGSLWEALSNRGSLTPNEQDTWTALMQSRKASEQKFGTLAMEGDVVDRSVGTNQLLRETLITQEQAIRLLVSENAALSDDLAEAGSTIARLRRTLEVERLNDQEKAPDQRPQREDRNLERDPMGGPDSCYNSALSSLAGDLPREYTFYFDLERSSPRPDILVQLDQVVGCLSTLDDGIIIESITVVGFSDPTGPQGLNEVVAASRADTAANILIEAVRDGELSSGVTVRRESRPSWAIDGSEENPFLRKVVVLIEYL